MKLSFVSEDDVLLVNTDDKVCHFNEYLYKNYSSIIYINDESLIMKAMEKSIVNELCDKKSLISELVIIFISHVQSAKKERTNEINSKFDKTYKHLFKVLSQFDIQRK